MTISRILLFMFLLLFEYNCISEIKKIKLLTVLFSCDRSVILNITITTFFSHVCYYEKNIDFNFYFVDSGTPNRMYYTKKYKIMNIFFMNPNNYEYSYGMFWSYLHGDYVLFLEDDRPFIKGVEKYIYYPNYVEEAVLVLKELQMVKGIILKPAVYNKAAVQNVRTAIGKHTLYIITDVPGSYFYTNGPAVYKAKDLLLTGEYKSEPSMGFNFKKRKWYTGFTYKGLLCKTNISSSNCQGVSYHTDIISTQNKHRNICKISLY